MRGQPGAGVAGSALTRMAAFDDRDQASLRVTNISEDTAEADLQVLFAPYGRIARIYLAKDRETMISRGFAFVSYIHRQDAERAMAALQGHGYDHLILKIEWAKPSVREPTAEGGGLSSGYTSGYGKALAQDTKEKVSFASNLTHNR
jgi:translation initiation factor 3 subunit G